MGALHCVTGGHVHGSKARTTGEIADMRRSLRLRTSTRGFDTAAELQQASTAGLSVFLALRRRQIGNGRAI